MKTRVEMPTADSGHLTFDQIKRKNGIYVPVGGTGAGGVRLVVTDGTPLYISISNSVVPAIQDIWKDRKFIAINERIVVTFDNTETE